MRLLLVLLIIPFSSTLGQIYTPAGNVGTVTNGTNNVGIGTTAPIANLDVYGQIRASVSESRFLYMLTNTDGNAYFNYKGGSSSSRIGFQVDGSSKMSITNDGKVGIGTASPSGRLEVYSNDSGSDQLHINNGNTAGRVEVILKEGGTIKAAFQYRGTTNSLFPNSLRVMTQSGTNADVFLGANGGHHLFISGGQNGLVMGRVGIGTSTPDSELTVKGSIHAEEVKVDLNVSGPDYVFEKDYNLLPLSEVEAYVNQNKHLPEVPSAKEMEVNGIKLGEMNMILLKKVEELTLHLIEQDKKVEILQQSNDHLKKQNDEIILKLKKIESQ